MQFVSILIYAALSVAGLTLVKLGSNSPLALSIGQSGFSVGIGWVTLLGLIIYIVSFLVYMTLVAKYNLTYLTPVSSGIVYVLTMLVSLCVLKEQITPMQWGGWCLILVGVVLMNIKK